MSEQPQKEKHRGAIAWMAGNSVASNLLMLVLLVGGLLIGLNIKQEVFPDFDLDMVNVTVAYPGASPEEVEQGIILPVEEAVQGLEGVKEIVSTANEGSGTIAIEAIEGADVTRLWQEIKSEVDRIDTFPEEAMEPSVAIAARKRDVIAFALYGDVSEGTLREVAETVRDELLSDPEITQVEFEGIRDMEIHVEVSQANLRRYGLTLGDVSTAVARASVELGGGALETPSGDILVRVKDRRDYAKQFARLPIITAADGSQLLLEDIATVTEGFEDADSWASYNGKPAIRVEVYRVGDQKPIPVAAAARKVVERLNETLPGELKMNVVRDRSEMFAQRAELLMNNAYLGLALVFVMLALFLEIRLAFWVSMGIPISFLGAFLILAPMGFSINMITMFAFIVTLGIVVDDAIVVGENIHYHRQRGMGRLQAAILGAREVAMPVVFSVITNMVAFLPLFFVPGIMGKIFRAIPMVVVAVFAISLVESLFILPAHLSHSGERPLFWPLSVLQKWQASFSRKFEHFVRHRYGGLLALMLKHRYIVLALGVAMLIATVGYIQSGRMGMVLFPKIEADYAYCEAILPYGSPRNRIEEVESRLVGAAEAVVEQGGGDKLAIGIFSYVRENKVAARIYLVGADRRPMSTAKVTDLWRQKAGTFTGLESITFESDRGGPGHGKSLTVQLSHRNKDLLDAAGRDLAAALEDFPMVSDIDDGSAKGKRQYDIHLLPAGKSMGLTSRDVANQVRYAFQGSEALRQLRGRNEVTVRVRLPENERADETTLEDLVLLSPKGEIMLRDAVRMVSGRAFTSIGRTDGRRVVSVTANVRPASLAENVLRSVRKNILPELVQRYPGLTYSFEGKQADIRESVTALITGLLMTLLAIYALLAIPFRSYFQPVIIMFCIPFGMIGAVVGHVIMGYSLSVMSLFGIVALSGVVVNDSLVMIDFANRKKRGGAQAPRAILESGIQRFRPIMLTTLTTFGGLAPMILETSRQARFLIPMALSLGFGILFATFITLAMVPALYLVLEDIGGLFKRKPGPEVDSLPSIEELQKQP